MIAGFSSGKLTLPVRASEVRDNVNNNVRFQPNRNLDDEPESAH